MQPLSIDVAQYGTVEGISENIRSALSLGLQELQFAPAKHDGTFVICGSGPSIESQIENIRADKEAGKAICAVKGAYDYLRSKGITPDLYLSVEPRYRPVKNPSKESSFLLASRCHPEVFKELSGYCIYLWHSWSIDDESELIKDKTCIGGGTTSGLRAVNVGFILGYRKFIMYGMDSCLGERGEKRVDEPTLGKGVEKTDVVVGGRRFICNMAMAAQAQDFQHIYTVMPSVTIDVRGGGLLAAIVEERKARGMHA